VHTLLYSITLSFSFSPSYLSLREIQRPSANLSIEGIPCQHPQQALDPILYLFCRYLWFEVGRAINCIIMLGPLNIDREFGSA
jgi:hypothetical protein